MALQGTEETVGPVSWSRDESPILSGSREGLPWGRVHPAAGTACARALWPQDMGRGSEEKVEWGRAEPEAITNGFWEGPTGFSLQQGQQWPWGTSRVGSGRGMGIGAWSGVGGGTVSQLQAGEVPDTGRAGSQKEGPSSGLASRCTPPSARPQASPSLCTCSSLALHSFVSILFILQGPP